MGTLVWVGLDFVTYRPMSLPCAGICLAYFTSGFNTAAVDHEADGSTNNGIFQISSRKWCKNFTPNVPNQCQMYCSGRLGPSLGLAGGRLLHPPLRLYGFFPFLFVLLAFTPEWEPLPHVLLDGQVMRVGPPGISFGGPGWGGCPESYRNGGGLASDRRQK